MINYKWLLNPDITDEQVAKFFEADKKMRAKRHEQRMEMWEAQEKHDMEMLKLEQEGSVLYQLFKSPTPSKELEDE